MKKLVFGAALVMLGIGAAHAQDASPSASASPATTAAAIPECKPAVPEKEHTWFKQLEGEWDIDTEVLMDPAKPPVKGKAKETTKLMGAFFVDADMDFEMGPGQKMKSRMTIGYDTKKKKYVGTFVSDMDAHMWVYEGTMDAAGKVLSLEAEGPAMMDPRGRAKYIDAVQVVDADHRTFTSSIQGADGKWTTFMTNHYTRKK